jgi:hypothetical protein
LPFAAVSLAPSDDDSALRTTPHSIFVLDITYTRTAVRAKHCGVPHVALRSDAALALFMLSFHQIFTLASLALDISTLSI